MGSRAGGLLNRSPVLHDESASRVPHQVGKLGRSLRQGVHVAGQHGHLFGARAVCALDRRRVRRAGGEAANRRELRE